MTAIAEILSPSIHRLTADEFEAMPNAKGFELVDGSLVEMNVGTESSWFGGEVFAHLWLYVRGNKLGLVFPQETGFRCFAADRDRIRKPDAAFIAAGRLPAGRLPQGFCTVVPDLAIEVVSPHDDAGDLEAKVLQYLEAGVRLVWVIYPATRSAHVLRLSGSHSHLRSTDSLDGEDVVPGFSLPLGQLFQDPAGSH